MSSAEHSTNLLLEHRHRMERLPPTEDAPILEKLNTVGTEAFQSTYAIETPLYKNGTVNHRALVKAAKNLVRSDYEWEAPFFDEHHLYWPGADYELPTLLYEGPGDRQLFEKGGNNNRFYEAGLLDTSKELPSWTSLPENQIIVDRLFSELIDLTEFEEFDDATKEYFAISAEFRELAMNKLWVPRQFHNFIHAVTRPPEMPEIDVMRRIVRNARRREYLFQVATSARVISEKLERSISMELPAGGAILHDRKDKRFYHNPQDMEERREKFIRELINYHQEGAIDLTRLAPMEVVDSRSVERSLGAIAARLMSSDLVKTRQNRMAWRVEVPTKPRLHTVWLRGATEQ